MEAQISFASKEFRSGQSVSGQVILTLPKPSKINDLSLEFVGESCGRWLEGRIEHLIGETFWRSVLVTEFPRRFGVDPESELVPAGSYRFEFWQNLPMQLPSTLTTELDRDNGRILYRCQVLVETNDWLQDRTVQQVAQVPFLVSSHLNLNGLRPLNPQIASGLQSDNNSFDSSCCCIPNKRKVWVTLNLPKSGFALGETLPITLEILNKSSNRHVRGIRVRLSQLITFVENFDSLRDGTEQVEKLHDKKTVAEVGWGSFMECLEYRPQQLIDVPPRATQTLLLPFPIPQALSNVSTVIVPVSIRLTYELEVKVKPGPCLRFPIVIGHVALNETLGGEELEQTGQGTCSKNEVRYLNQTGHPVQVQTNDT